MTERVAIRKVICYIVRDEQLLVFRHVGDNAERAGLQVPAGTVFRHETPEETALREAREQTGLSAFSLNRNLGKTLYDMSPHRYEVQERYFFRLRISEPTPDTWYSTETHDGVGEPTKLECFWLPLTDAHVLAAGQGAMLGRLFV